jgi:hypothetical protein
LALGSSDTIKPYSNQNQSVVLLNKEYLTDELLVEEVRSVEIDGLSILLFLLVTPVVLNHGVAGFFWCVAKP